MNLTKMKYLYSLVVLVILSSCTEKIDLDLNKDDNIKLVVEGSLTTESKEHMVRLTTSTNYFDDVLPPPATGATVNLNDGFTNISLVEKPIGSGLYFTPIMKGEVKRVYNLQITYSGKLHETSSAINDTASVTGLNYEECTDIDDDYKEELEEKGLKCYTLLLNTQELPGRGDHYLWKVYKNGQSLSDTIKDLNFSNDDLVDGSILTDFPLQTVEAQPGDTIKVEQYNINKSDYDFFVSTNLLTIWRGGLFDTPPANVFTAISNGAYGYFLTSGFSSKETIILP